MTKNIIVLALGAGFLFTSCSKDDDQPEEFTIVGKWSPTREITVSGINGVTISNIDTSPCEKTSVYNFKTDNTVTSIYFEQINGLCENTGTETVPYTYNYSTNKLTVDNEPVEIVSQTINELQIVSGFDDVDGDGTDDKIIQVITKM